MFKNITPEKAFAFTRYCVALSCCWPPSRQAPRSKVTRFRILRSLALLNVCLLLPALGYSVYVNFHDNVNLSQAVWHSICMIQISMNMCTFIFQYNLLQELIAETVKCYKNAKSNEKCVYQQYIDKFFSFYAISGIWTYFTALIVIIVTMFIPGAFPVGAAYPFPVNYQPVRSIIYLHQTISIFQTAAHVSMPVFCALFALFATARFDVLRMELCEVTNSSQLISCMKRYQRTRRFAKRISNVVRPVALIAIIMCCSAISFCAISYMEPQPFSARLQTIPVVCTGFIEVFMYAWPADHLLDLSQNVMRSIYESRWYQQSTSKQKDVLLVLLPQEPVGVKVVYIIPSLSLNYYCSFVSNVMSLFTLLRTTLQEEDYDG